MSNLVEVVAYEDQWPRLFAIESEQIRQVLGANCIAIHHIGSTAVPGLSAKPIIDILPVVKDILQVDQCSNAMKNMGYTVKGENGMLFRRFFHKTVEHKYNVHVFEQGNPEIERHIKFRDWMRTHDNDREAYAALKASLALKYPDDILSYCFGKDQFVAEIDRLTGFTGLRVVQALTNREWGAVRKFRQQYFFDRIPVSDPYTWTFQHHQHVHLVLYQGPDIVGYAHLQSWPDHRVAMRIIVIDVPYRNKGIGSHFLKLCERWLSHQNMKTLLVQSSPDAYQFYSKNGYISMPFNDPDGYGSDPRDIEVGKNLK